MKIIYHDVFPSYMRMMITEFDSCEGLIIVLNSVKNLNAGKNILITLLTLFFMEWLFLSL